MSSLSSTSSSSVAVVSAPALFTPSPEATLRLVRAEILHALRGSGPLANARAVLPRARPALITIGAFGANEDDSIMMLHTLVAVGLLDRNTLLPAIWTECPLMFDGTTEPLGCLLRVAPENLGGVDPTDTNTVNTAGVIDALRTAADDKKTSQIQLAASFLTTTLHLPLVNVGARRGNRGIGASVNSAWESDTHDVGFAQPPRIAIVAAIEGGLSKGGVGHDFVSIRPTFLGRKDAIPPGRDDAGDAERSVFSTPQQNAAHTALRGLVRATGAIVAALHVAWPEQIDQVLPFLGHVASQLVGLQLTTLLQGAHTSANPPRRTLRAIASTFHVGESSTSLSSSTASAKSTTGKRPRSSDSAVDEGGKSSSTSEGGGGGGGGIVSTETNRDITEELSLLAESLTTLRAAFSHTSTLVAQWPIALRAVKHAVATANDAVRAAALRSALGALALSDAVALRSQLLHRKAQAHAALEHAAGGKGVATLLDAIAADEAARVGEEIEEEGTQSTGMTLGGLLRQRQDSAERATMLETTIDALKADLKLAAAVGAFSARAASVAAAFGARVQASLQRATLHALLASDAALTATIVAILRAASAVRAVEVAALAAESLATAQTADAVEFYGDAAPALRARLDSDAQKAVLARADAAAAHEALAQALSSRTLKRALSNAPLEQRLTGATRCSSLLSGDTHTAFDPLLLGRRLRESGLRAARLQGIAETSFRVPSALRHMSALSICAPISAALIARVGWKNPCNCEGAPKLPCRVLPTELRSMINFPRQPLIDTPMTSLSISLLRSLALSFSRAEGSSSDISIADEDGEEGKGEDSGEKKTDSTAAPPTTTIAPTSSSHFSLFDEGGLFAPGTAIPGPGQFDDGDDLEDEEEHQEEVIEVVDESEEGGKPVEIVEVKRRGEIVQQPPVKRARDDVTTTAAVTATLEVDSDENSDDVGESKAKENRGWCMIM